MKAPDKIYTCYNIEEGEKRQLWSTVLLSDVEQVGEYIRKDALQEWAKFVLKCQEEELAQYAGPSYMRASTMGRIDAYKVLIAKLNSM